MDDHLSSRKNREHIEIIDVGRIDDVAAEFPTEASLQLDRPNESGPREFDYRDDDFPCESSLLGVVESDEEPAIAQELQFAAAPAPIPAGAGHRRGAAPALIVALAVVTITIAGAVGLRVLSPSRAQDEGPSASASDVVLTGEAPARPLSAPVDLLPPAPETLPSSTVGTMDSREERTPPPPSPTPPSRPSRIVDQQAPAAGTGPTGRRQPASAEVLASSTNLPVANTPTRTRTDVPPAAPVGTASAPTAAAERTAVDRAVDVNPVPAGRAAAAPVVTPTVVTPPVVTPVVTPNSGIERALARYQSAFSSLDVGAVRQVWPTVDGKALTRAFDQLRQENLTFDSCDVRVFPGSAVAFCVGTTEYVPKVGNKNPRVERQQWRISLRQAADAWVIDTVEVSRN